MPKQRSPNRDKAKEIYMQYKGEVQLTVISDQLNIPESTVRGWKAKDNWDAELNGTFQSSSKNNMERSNQNTERSNQNTERSKRNEKKPSNKYHEKKRYSKTADKASKKTNTNSNSQSSMARYGNKNAEGNCGGNGAPEGNAYAAGNKGGHGGPDKNQHAVGNTGGLGAPLRNKHAVRTHEFETFYYDDLDEGERAFFELDDCFNDKYFLQRALIKDLTRRERRIRKAIVELENTPGGLVYESVTKSKGTIKTEFKRDKKDNERAEDNEACLQEDSGVDSEHKKNNMVQTQENSSHVAKPVLIRVMQLEEALTRVEARKQQAIAQLHRMEMDDEKAEREKNKPTDKSGEKGASSGEQSKAMSKAAQILDSEDPAVQKIFKKLLDGYNDLNDSFEDE